MFIYTCCVQTKYNQSSVVNHNLYEYNVYEIWYARMPDSLFYVYG